MYDKSIKKLYIICYCMYLTKYEWINGYGIDMLTNTNFEQILNFG